MIRLAGPQAVAEWIGKPGFVPVDPRRPMKYLSGHLSGAINVPMYRTFGDDGALRDPADLARWLGEAGIGEGVTPVLYDSPHGQNAAMLAWILTYLGAPEVILLDIFFERWKADGRDVAYRAVHAEGRRFTPRADERMRATLEQVRTNTADRLVDFRSREEFTGERDVDGHPGHIPHALNIVWSELNGDEGHILPSADRLARMFSSEGLQRGQKIIAYCRSGPRAALGYLALVQAGYEARLFDGSFAAWARAGLPAEK